MKLKKIIALISFLVIIITILVSYCWYSTLDHQKLGEKEFSDFLIQKRKLFQTNEEVSLVKRIIYSWDNQTFIESSAAVADVKNFDLGDVVSRKEVADLDKNSIQEIYTLENGRLSVTENSKIIWQSPTDWWLDDFVLADSNNDGIADINLSLWKTGNFGTSKPFWVEENDMSIKNHFFIFDLINGTMKMVWGSSNLEAPNCQFKIADVDNDGKNDLVVIEGNYSPELICKGNYLAVWQWNGWGFANEWRSEKGNFSNLEIEKKDKKSYIVVNSLSNK
jgi:poly-gamma-glutamate synthesis protein (capsule biosynthesis protein)